MSDFWSTLLAALLGALVGGAFTAFGAWWQTRGLQKVTSHQIEEALQQGHEQARRQVKVEAALELQRALGPLWTKVHDIHRDHRDHQPTSCEVPDLRALLAEEIATLDRTYLLYERMFGDWKGVDEVLMEIFEFLDDVIMGRGPAYVRPVDVDLLKDNCRTYAWCNGASDLVYDATDTIRTAMAHEVGAVGRAQRAVQPSEHSSAD